MKAQDLRIGNLVEYKITDEFDERKEWWEVSEIDADDIHWLSKVDTNDDDFRAIPLTEEWLLKFGFENYCQHFLKRGSIEFYIWGSLSDNTKFAIKALDTLIEIKYVHQLQNIYFSLEGEELKINQ